MKDMTMHDEHVAPQLYDDSMNNERRRATGEDRSSSEPEVDIDLEESSPLLENGRAEPTPLPLLQLLILATVRLAEPISFTQVFPYLNQMMEELDIAGPADVGYFSGLVGSTFSFAQLFTIYFWSSLSDRVGRKPVVIVGLLGATISSGCFGFSRSLPMMLLARALAGMLSGNVAVVSSMLSEMTDKTNEGKAFPLLGATWAIGGILGPIIGGNLSKPVERFPSIFGNSTLFKEYPYLLPCLVSQSISLCAIVLCAVFVKETLPSKIAAQQARKLVLSKNQSYGSISSTSLIDSPPAPISELNQGPKIVAKTNATVSSNSKGGVRTLLNQAPVRAVLASGFMLSFLVVACDVVFVLYSYTPIKLGGMGRSPTQIGYALAGSGTAGTFLGLVVFPWAQRRFDNRQLYAALTCLWPLGFSLMPIGNIAARAGGTPRQRDVIAWAAIALMLIPFRLGAMVFPLNMIIVKNSPENSDQLGAMFGLQQTVSSLARAMAPAVVSTSFAFSIENQWLLNGWFVWVIMVLVGLVAIRAATRVVNVSAPKSRPASRTGK